ARPAFVSRQRYSKDFLLINDLEESPPDHVRAYRSWGILALVILCAATGLGSMLTASLLGAGARILTRCCTLPEARRSLDLSVILTIGASFALGAAIAKTGAAVFLGNGVLEIAGHNPWLLLLLTYLSVSVLTEIISNNAAAILMLPIVLA